MIYQVMNIKAETYEEPAKLYLYLLEKSLEIGIDKRPLIFICPGGGYGMTSDREAEAIALQFVAAGFHAAVLRYSVAPARYPTALLQVAAGFKYLREHAEESTLMRTGWWFRAHLQAAIWQPPTVFSGRKKPSWQKCCIRRRRC